MDVEWMVETAFSCGKSVGLFGPPAIGKTTLFEQVAKKNKKKVETIILARRQGSDFCMPYAKDDVLKYLISDRFKQIAEEGNYILFFDELDRASGETRNAVLSLINERKFEQVTLPDTVWIAIAGNGSSCINTEELDDAEVSRICIIELDIKSGELHEDHWYVNSWSNWAHKNGFNSKLLTFILQNPKYLYLKDEGELSFSCPRELENVSDVINQKESELKKKDTVTVTALISGFVGRKVGEKIVAYLTIFGEVPEVVPVITKKVELSESITHRLVFVEKSYQHIRTNQKDIKKVLEFFNNDIGKEFLYLLLKRTFLDEKLKDSVKAVALKEAKIRNILVEYSDVLIG